MTEFCDDCDTYWDGIQTPAKRGTAVVADASYFLQYWAKEEGLIGTRIAVVQIDITHVNYNKVIIYIDNRDGSGWSKVTTGRGLPYHGHAILEVEPGTFKEE